MEGLTIHSKDIVLELPVAVYHPATLPPPPPEPYPYPAPDLLSDPHRSSASPPPPGPTPILYADLLPSPYSPPPTIPLFSQSIPAPLSTQLVIPPYRAYDGQLWFPSPPPAYVGAYQDQPPPPRPASTNVSVARASVLPAGLPISDTPDHHYSYRQHQHYPPQPEEETGHGARAARISHHLRATSRARSASPAQILPPTQVAVDVIAPKPMPSPEVVTETHDATDNDDLFARSFGRMGTRTRSLSVVKLEEMAARAAAETEAKARAERQGREAAVDKTLPAPPVPSGKPSGYGANRRVFAQDIFHQMAPEETVGKAETDAGAEIVPRTPSLSALSLLRPPPRRDKPAFPSCGEQGIDESGLDALERRLAEQVGTRKPPALPPPDLRTVLGLGSASPLPPPPPVPAPVPVPGKKAQSMAQEQADDDGAGAAVNESAISSLALGAEEDFGGRNAKTNPNPALPDVQVECEEEAEAEGEDVDVDGRTQRQGKGTGASSSSERGTYKALSRKSVKSDSKEKDRERERAKNKEGKAKRKKKRDGRREERDDEAARLRSAAKGRVAEWLGKLEVCEPGTEPELDIKTEPDSSTSASPPVPEQTKATTSQTEPVPMAVEAIVAAPAASSPTTPPPVIET